VSYGLRLASAHPRKRLIAHPFQIGYAKDNDLQKVIMRRGSMLRVILAALVAVATLVAVNAEAARQQRLSATDQQILNSLTPQARQEVMSRLTPGQTVEGIVETMVLNRLSRMYVEGKIEVIEVAKGTAVVVMPDGKRETVTYKVDEIVLAQ
jgi:hypothetical protein